MVTEFQERADALREGIFAACTRVGRSIDTVRTIVVTKTHPVEALQMVLDAGFVNIGESRVQEIVQKAPQLTGKRVLHMVGHLQTNKVAKVVPLVDWIQSLDSERLLRKVEAQCSATGKTLDALVQVNTSGEDTKSGCRLEEALELCEKVAAASAVRFRGLMTIGPLDAGESETRRAFAALRNVGEKCRHLTETLELSMGMSGDFEWAIEEGATMIRIGSLLLGARPNP
jgi:pyridoxal phosphate enzyme (YggS family)